MQVEKVAGEFSVAATGAAVGRSGDNLEKKGAPASLSRVGWDSADRGGGH